MTHPLDHFPRPWTKKFDEHGGYDCISSAIIISSANGKLVTTIDLADVSQVLKGFRLPAWEHDLDVLQAAEALANELIGEQQPDLPDDVQHDEAGNSWSG